jgi:phosphomannomutase
MAGIFKAYDIRGRFPDELDELTAKKTGFAFSRLMNGTNVVIGRDSRLSSPPLAESFIEGYVAAGGSITDIGMTSTPLLYHTIISKKFGGGVMVTASHLPGDMNGFKLCREDAIPLSEDQGLPALEKMVREMSSGLPVPAGNGSCVKAIMLDAYIDAISRYVQKPKSLLVAADAGDGMAGPELNPLFSRFPVWKILPLSLEPDGRFPHHGANPFIASATRKLQDCVIDNNADFGVAFDGDADRCIFIDEKGARISSDLATALIAEYYLMKEPGSTILYDLRSSRVLQETIDRLGGIGKRCRVGHAFIKTRMREENAIFAGELSGHYYFRDMGYCDNGIFTMIQVLNLLAIKDEPLSRLIQPLRKYHSTGEVNMRVSTKEAVMVALGTAFSNGEIDYLDGITAQYDSWWFNVRASNTEPLIRLNLEADTLPLMEKKKTEVLRVIRDTDPAMQMETE